MVVIRNLNHQKIRVAPELLHRKYFYVERNKKKLFNIKLSSNAKKGSCNEGPDSLPSCSPTICVAIVNGYKAIEKRSKKTDYRGDIVILSSTPKTTVNNILKRSKRRLPTVEFLYGYIIGAVELYDIIPLSQDRESDPWVWGPYCWKLRKTRVFSDPIPALGKLNLCNLDEELSANAAAAIATSK